MRMIFSAVVMAALAAPAMAQDGDAAQELEDKTRNVGVAVGKAFTCLGEDEARKEKLKVGAQMLFDMILKDLGSDTAFVFATAAGYGAGLPKSGNDCAEIAERWEAIKDNFDISDVDLGGEE